MNEELTPAIKPGIYLNIENEAYHRGTGISKSALDKISRSPAHYKSSLEAPAKPTDSMILGSAVHAAILEPDLFASKYIAMPKIDRRTKTGKEDYAAFIAANLGKEVLEQDDYDKAISIRDVVYSHPTASVLLQPKGVETTAESSIYWYAGDILEEMGVTPSFTLCKCRPDFMRDDRIVVDIKTTTDARSKEFQRSVANYRYHVQNAYYVDGIESTLEERVREFLFLCVETTPPYGVAIYNLDDDAIFAGRSAYEQDLRTYIRCKNTNRWPCYDDDIHTLQLPRWAA